LLDFGFEVEFFQNPIKAMSRVIELTGKKLPPFAIICDKDFTLLKEETGECVDIDGFQVIEKIYEQTNYKNLLYLISGDLSREESRLKREHFKKISENIKIMHKSISPFEVSEIISNDKINDKMNQFDRVAENFAQQIEDEKESRKVIKDVRAEFIGVRLGADNLLVSNAGDSQVSVNPRLCSILTMLMRSNGSVVSNADLVAALASEKGKNCDDHTLEASDVILRKRISELNKLLKNNNVPFEINSRKGIGRFLAERTALNKS